MLSQQISPNEASADSLSVQRNAPNLFVIGAMKASTTTFYELITRHPEIWFSHEKEPHYFTSTNYGEPAAWDKYLQLFGTAPSSAKWIGEASTGYSKLPHFGNTPMRIQKACDDPRFIYLVRDPVERTISNYQHAYLSGHYPAGTNLATAIEKDPILIDASLYAQQIRAYREVFDEQALLVITTDQLHEDPTAAMRRVERFLELRAFDGWETSLPQSNSKQALSSSIAWQSILPKPVFGALRKLLPGQVRRMLKSLAKTKPSIPPITESARQMVFEQIADDLSDLVTLMSEEQSRWIASWPSVKRLGER